MEKKIITAVAVVLAILVIALVYQNSQRVLGAPDGAPVRVSMDCPPGKTQTVTRAVYGSPSGTCRKRSVVKSLNESRILESGLKVSPEALGVPPCKGGGMLGDMRIECR